ncbi:MAG: amidohydrolase [Bacteroidales bacterium]|jgi:5-methylthioadenosine/S-adenosylhomocysteine deaminase|nr:amidohydrolase [Bacteroidales bacterium]MDD2618204.1 amidohydrolase [Bacteroidales bacterium]
MNSILIKNILLDKQLRDVLIEGNRFTRIEKNIEVPADLIVDGSDKALLPPFYNAHTHAAMSLLRGCAEDMPLTEWLQDKIWPLEAKMQNDDHYVGVRLAILEMIKSGTVFFSDMYFNVPDTIRAVEEMGIRAAIGVTFLESNGPKYVERGLRFIENLPETSSRVQITITPHAVYTVSADLFKRLAAIARERSLIIHTHLAETLQEVQDCIATHGMSPVRWLDHLGLLGPNTVAAHVIHVDDYELEILRDRGVWLVHNPCSNMKLGSGVFRSADIIEKKLNVALGTDGCSSNNNLDMREEMKIAALLAKVHYGSEVLKVDEVFHWATLNGARAYGLDAGEIAVGKLADALIIDLNNVRMLPTYDLLSNWVYSADSSCIDSVICDGRFLMQGGKVPGEEFIMEAAKKAACRLAAINNQG